MVTFNIYSYRWAKLQKKCVYPQLSQQVTHLEDEGFLRQTAPLHVDVYVALVLDRNTRQN